MCITDLQLCILLEVSQHLFIKLSRRFHLRIHKHKWNSLMNVCYSRILLVEKVFNLLMCRSRFLRGYYINIFVSLYRRSDITNFMFLLIQKLINIFRCWCINSWPRCDYTLRYGLLNIGNFFPFIVKEIF